MDATFWLPPWLGQLVRGWPYVWRSSDRAYARESLITHGQAIAQISTILPMPTPTGFKAVRTEFEDLFAEGSGGLFGAPIPVGNGSAVDKERILQDKQGSLDFTDRSLDVAIDGGGFFQTTNGTDTFYTRAGIFTVNSDGEIVTAEGDQLMGFTETSPTAPVALSVAGSTLSAQATSTVTIRGNANTTAPLLAGWRLPPRLCRSRRCRRFYYSDSGNRLSRRNSRRQSLLFHTQLRLVIQFRPTSMVQKLEELPEHLFRLEQEPLPLTESEHKLLELLQR